MKIQSIYILLTILIITVITILLFSCSQNDNTTDKTRINENLIQVKKFSVNSDSTELNTLAKGEIFVKGAKGVPEHIQIVARIEIDPEDWGGIAFYIPKKWNISDIVSSYPENGDQIKPADYITIWSTASDRYKWDKWIEIGRSSNYKPRGGGTGTVVIDLVADKNAVQKSEKYNIMVAVGSDEKDGSKILGADSTSIEIP